jgi:uncharacterized membrane protein YgcG
MKKILILLLGLITLLIFPSSVLAVEDIVVNEHRVEIYVQEDGVYRFTHQLDVTYQTPHYGIYVNIPQEYEMEWVFEDGTTENRKYVFPLSNFNIDGPHEFESSREGVQLRLGEAGVYVSGQQQYSYSYQMKTKDLRLDGRQRFYLNILGDGWDIPTDKLTFTIYFPQDMSEEEINFYAGKYGVNTPASLEYDVVENMLQGSTTTTLNPNESFTIDIALEAGYFEFPKEMDMSIFGLLYGFIFFGLLVFMFLRYGRDEKSVPTIQFGPPSGYSSAQVGYIYDGFTENKDILSLIIEWAANGHLSIEELSEKSIKLTKITELPDNAITAEKTIFNSLFITGDEVTTDELKHNFYTTLVNGKMNITRYFTGNKKRRIFSIKADVLQVLFGITLPSILAIYLGLAYYQITNYAVDALLFVGFAWGIGLLVSITSILTRRKFHTFKSFTKLMSILGNIILVLVYAVVVYGASTIAEADLFILFVLFILYAVALFINSTMHQRTRLGNQLYNDILGLKLFIETAEKDRLETLVGDDPSYFYHILPYAYVLNITDTWSKKFEDIAIASPSWYVGQTPMNHIIFMSHFNRSINTLATTMSTPPATKSGSGGGSFGGGGGGFSGGGFGGGGGGGWG